MAIIAFKRVDVFLLVFEFFIQMPRVLKVNLFCIETLMST